MDVFSGSGLTYRMSKLMTLPNGSTFVVVNNQVINIYDRHGNYPDGCYNDKMIIFSVYTNNHSTLSSTGVFVNVVTCADIIDIKTRRMI